MNKAIQLPVMLIMGIAILICGTGVAGAAHVEIGTGTSSENYVPFNGYYDYGWSKIIYTQSEIGDTITINEIAFDVSSNPSSYNVDDQRIYMAHTTDGTFADGTKPDPLTMTEVYNGSITWDGSGWCVITLDTPFSYNNVDNLLIYYENRDGSWASGNPSWYYTSQSNRAAYKYQDNSFPAVAGSLSLYVPNVRLYYTPCLQVEKMVYNGSAWVDEISDAQLGSTYRFRINVTSNCCNFTEIVVKDILSSSMTYADSATPFEPNSTVGNVRYWNFSALDKGETVTIEFDVSANTYGYDCNVANVTANCTDTGAVIHTAEDNACLNTAPLPNTFDAVWDNMDDPASTLGEDIFDICTADDLDEDGSQEIITGDQNGNVTVFENTGNDQYTDVWHVTPDGNDILAVCVCDLDGNGRKEIIAGGLGDTVYVYEWDGVVGSNNYLPVSSLNIGDDINDLCCSDIDGDGDCELGIACADDHAYIYSVSGAWTWNMEFDSGDVGYDIYSVLCCCDLNNNGDKEFIFAEYDYDETYIYEATAPDTYAMRWQQKVSSSDGRPYSMVCCDMDGDGYQELYIGDNNGELIVVTNTGDLTTCGYSLVHDFGTTINKLACGDEDADGMNDLYLAMDDNDITDLEFFGTDVTDYSHYFKSVIGVDLNAGNDAMAVHCTDLDGDGNREVIAGYERLISYPSMKLLHVLEHSASCTLPGIDADKTVYDPKTDTWVDSISGAIPGATYRFRINVTATCCNFTDVVINDTLSPSLSYAGNPSPSAPTVIGNVCQWTFSTLNKSETKTIEFDATVSYRGDDCNLANATGWCNESLPHEQHSDEDTACIDSRVDLAVKSTWNEHIRVNPACGDLDYHRLIVNESNTIRVWVINNGPSNITAGEAFDVCFDLNGVGITCETVTGPLNAGDDVYFDIDMTPDCAGDPAWPNYPPMPGHPCGCLTTGYKLNVTVDASSVMNETNEGNNLGWRAVSVCCNGYKSKNFDCNVTDDPLTLFEYDDDFYGGVAYNVSGVAVNLGLTPYADTRIHHIDVPAGMTVAKARLYVYWYDWTGASPGKLANLSVNFDGAIFPTPDASYNDQKCLGGSYDFPRGTYVYDVTPQVSGSGDYMAIVTNLGASATSTRLLGEMLLVVYEDPGQDEANHIQLWLMEGDDLLMARGSYCVTPEEATATATFTGAVVANPASAELITVAANGMESGNNMLFNGNVIKTNAWAPGSEASPGSMINVETVSVTGDLVSSDNTVGFQDNDTSGMDACNAILIVHKEAGASPGEPVDTATGTGIAYFETDNGTIVDLIAVSEGDLPPEGKPDLQFPHGLFSFEITGLTGNTATVTITMPSNVPVGTQYWKYGPTPSDPTDHWYQIPMGSDDGDKVITITLVDGGLGDDDLTTNGVIVDDGGAGNPPPAEVPAMTPLGFVLVMISLFGLVMIVSRRMDK